MAKLIDIKKENKGKKIRVNITVDKELLGKAKTRLELFGGKVSTLFNSYLNDFVSTIDRDFGSERKEMQARIKELEDRLGKLEEKK